MESKPVKQHEWLQRMVGEWTSEAEMKCEDGQPPMKSKGTESVRSLGGLWVLADGRGDMPDGSPAIMMMTLGYNPQTQRYVGTWVGSMMAHLWIYDGELDVSGNILTLSSDGPSMGGNGSMASYRDVIEFKSADHRILTSHVKGEDGQWTQFMTAHYRRK